EATGDLSGVLPVPRGGCKHDRACFCSLVVGKPYDERSALSTVQAIEPRRLIGYRHLDPEFLRLVVCTCHQGHAADAGRKAQIVLDARGSPGLAAECTAVEDEHRQPFRAGIDGGGEARGPRTHDDDVIETVRIDRPQQTDAPG